MPKFLQYIGMICLPLWLSTVCPAVPFGLGTPLSAEEHIRIVSYKGNESNHWIFKLDLKKAEATLIPEAGMGDQEGISLRIAK